VSFDTSRAGIMRLTLGPDAVQGAVKHFARTSRWPDYIIDLLKGTPIPEKLQDMGLEARAKELSDQAIRDSRPSGLLPEEEAEIVVAPLRDVEWKPIDVDMIGVCRCCGQKHLDRSPLCGS
jgi:hypothetical protein